MQAVLIRLRSLMRSRVIAPFRALAAPAKAFMVGPDGKTRWWQLGAFLAVVALLVLGLVVGLVKSLTGDAGALAGEPSAPISEGHDQEPQAGKFVGADVLLNPSMELDKSGRVPFVKTDNPGVLAEAYVRFSQTVDMSKDSADAWLTADQKWKTDFVPAGFDSVVTTAQEAAAKKAKFLQDWSRYSTVEPVLNAFSTGVFIDGEIAAAPAVEGVPGRPTVVQDIPAESAVHLVRVPWIGSMTPTKKLDLIDAQDGEGASELLIVCPGAEGFTQDSCKVVDAVDEPSKFLSLRLNQWPAHE